MNARVTLGMARGVIAFLAAFVVVACGDEVRVADGRGRTGEADVTRELFDGVVDTDYGQFDLYWSPDHLGYDGSDDRYFAGQVNGLVGAGEPGGVYVNLARRSGGSSVRIVLLGSEPPVGEQWEDVVEVSTTVPDDAVPGWGSWAGETGGQLEISAGTYRLRVSARGRDAGRGDGEFADGVVDFYLLELWPAPSAEDVVVRVESEDARYWHQQRGGSRSD